MGPRLDLSSQQSVRRFAAEYAAQVGHCTFSLAEIWDGGSPWVGGLRGDSVKCVNVCKGSVRVRWLERLPAPHYLKPAALALQKRWHCLPVIAALWLLGSKAVQLGCGGMLLSVPHVSSLSS